MKTDEAFSTLVGRIYDCALDTFLWPEVLGAITHAVNGRMGFRCCEPSHGHGPARCSLQLAG
jgi:hypothetical protein